MLDDKIGIKLSYPDLSKLGKVDKIDTAESGMDIIKDCIDMIYTEEEMYERGTFNDKELDEFVESLNTQQFTKIKDFFDTMPTLKHTVKYKCETCGEDKETTIQGLNSFFGWAWVIIHLRTITWLRLPWYNITSGVWLKSRIWCPTKEIFTLLC